MKPNSTCYANSQQIRILMMSVISGHVKTCKDNIYNAKNGSKIFGPLDNLTCYSILQYVVLNIFSAKCKLE